jgi:hypothetical protein
MNISNNLDEIHPQKCAQFMCHIHVLQNSVQSVTLPKSPAHISTMLKAHDDMHIDIPLNHFFEETQTCGLPFPFEVLEAEHYTPQAFLKTDPDHLQPDRNLQMVLLQFPNKCLQSAFSTPETASIDPPSFGAKLPIEA